MRILKFGWIVSTCVLIGCGTTYVVPTVQDTDAATATRMFAEARSDTAHSTISTSSAERRFQRVANRVQAAGKQICETEMADREDFDCNVTIAIDRDMKQRNAYFTYVNRRPTIRISMPLLQDTGSDDEVAFVLSHEYGHLIGRHIEKQQQQALAGALIMGAITAYANAEAASYGGYYDPNAVDRNMELGAAIGSRAYSQTYELESDTLGTYIAISAGYDPVEGAKYFARPEAARTTTGNLSFWGTHPPDEKRFATVLAAVRMIEERGALVQHPQTQ
ncbi:peptidase M48, Ste24p [Aestuarium zhoushanense]|nr:peptidase M48, Ste24p [Aestuarium zhoushanense]